MPAAFEISFWSCLWRGLCLRCPQCGQGKLFKAFYRLNKQCSVCAEPLEKDAMDTLGILYMSTAFFTGLGFLLMFWILPLTERAFRVGIALLMVLLILLSLPLRKGLAIALGYYMEKTWR